jgi:hypothetical protein
MVLARAYAGDETFCVPVMYHVLTGALMFARAALSGPHDKHYMTLAHRDMYDLLLLCLAVGTGLLHAEYKGVSKQSLLPSMRAAGSSSSSSTSGKPRRLAVSAHHEELLHALLGVRRLAAADDLTASTVSYTMWLIPHAVYEASRMRMKEKGSAQGGPDRGADRGADSIREVVPRPLALPLLLTQVEVLALAPPFYSEKLPVLQQALAFMSGSFDELRSWTRQQPWQQQQQQQEARNSPAAPSLGAVQSQLQECIQSMWLQLGPALLALCRRSSGEAAGEEDDDMPGCHLISARSGQLLGAVPPREVFATFSDMLMGTGRPWTGGWVGRCFCC